MKIRIYFFYGLLILGFLLLTGRLVELQIILGARNRQLAEGNRIKKIMVPAPRGIIYGRSDQPLVRNVPVYRLCPDETDCQTITREEALKLEAAGQTGELKTNIGRAYLYGPALSAALGYLGEANEEEVKNGQRELGDLLGRAGIEQRYDAILRGKDGGELIEVDARGRQIRAIGQIAPESGKDLQLTLDAKLSQVAYNALEGKKGAVVVSEVKTGQILVLVSSPSFDPEKITAKDLTGPDQPMFNRAIAGAYPPGSTFKIVTTAAGVEEGKIDQNTLFEDTGQITVGDYTYRNWYFTQYGKTEGKIDVVRAIKRSTDTFFYKVGEWVGPEKLMAWAREFGLGKQTGIDIGGEAAGLVPDPTGQRWFLGNTYHVAIGQGDLLTTPLQVNLMTAAIANGGKLCQPTIVNSQLQNPNSKSECQDLKLKPETLRLIKEGMKAVCATGGTAFPLFDFNPQVACKTGTAEFGDPQNRTHAWLTAFAPVDDPEISVTVLVEAGGEGSYVAAPIAKKVLEQYFKVD